MHAARNILSIMNNYPKKQSILTLLSFLLLVVPSYSQGRETHSPNYRCVHTKNGAVKYLLTGNKFLDGNGMDWSDEVILSSGQEYYGCSQDNQQIRFSYQQRNQGPTIPREFTTIPVTLVDGEISQMELINGEELYVKYIDTNCLAGQKNSHKSCTSEEIYLCLKSLGIDGQDGCP